MLSEKRIKEKAKDYGGLLYNPETDNYDVIIDDKIEKILEKNKIQEK